MQIEQPWRDERLKLDGVFIGCVKKSNADFILGMELALRQISAIENKIDGGDWDEIEAARAIANKALGLPDCRNTESKAMPVSISVNDTHYANEARRLIATVTNALSEAKQNIAGMENHVLKDELKRLLVNAVVDSAFQDN